MMQMKCLKSFHYFHKRNDSKYYCYFFYIILYILFNSKDLLTKMQFLMLLFSTFALASANLNEKDILKVQKIDNPDNAVLNIVKSVQTTVPIRKILQEEPQQDFFVLLLGSPIPPNLHQYGLIETYLEDATDFSCFLHAPKPFSFDGEEYKIVGYSGVRKSEKNKCIYIPLIYITPDSEDNTDVNKNLENRIVEVNRDVLTTNENILSTYNTVLFISYSASVYYFLIVNILLFMLYKIRKYERSNTQIYIQPPPDIENQLKVQVTNGGD